MEDDASRTVDSAVVVADEWAAEVEQIDLPQLGLSPTPEGRKQAEIGIARRPAAIGDGSARQAAADFTGPPDANVTDPHAIFHGGEVASGVPVVLIFWGAAWSQLANQQLAIKVVSAVKKLLAGQYLSGLTQYGVERPSLKKVFHIVSPGPPQVFDENDVGGVALDIAFLKFPVDGPNFYCVLMPPGVTYNGSADVDGTHTYSAGHLWYAWLQYYSAVDGLTHVFSHELVETLTDPEANGWYANPEPNGGEIGDVCERNGGEFVDNVYVCYYWSNEANACVVPTSKPRLVAKTPVTAVTNPPEFLIESPGVGFPPLDVFLVSTDGRLWTTWCTDQWQYWFALGAKKFTAGTPIAGLRAHDVSASIEGLPLELFAVGQDGAVWTNSLHGGGSWVGWTVVPGTATFTQLTPLAAVSRDFGQVDLFAVGQGGSIWTNSSESGSWAGWTILDGAPTFPQLTPLAALSKAEGEIDLFGVAQDGTVWTNAFNDNALDGPSWRGWAQLQGSPQFTKLTPIAAVSKAVGQIDLFAVGPNSRVWTNAFNSNNAPAWSGWTDLPQASPSFPKLTPVAPVSKTEGFLDLFAVGSDGHVWTNWYAGNWGAWTTLSGTQQFPQLTPITAASKAEPQIDLFAVDQAGRPLTSSSTGAAWTPWTQLP
jgi:hypothetical protein